MAKSHLMNVYPVHPALNIGPNLDADTVLYCRGDGMSISAGNALVDLGYCAVRYLEGGMIAWEEAGFDLDP